MTNKQSLEELEEEASLEWVKSSEKVHILYAGGRNHAIGKVYEMSGRWYFVLWKFCDLHRSAPKLDMEYSYEYEGEEGLEKTKKHVEGLFWKSWQSFK